MTEIHDTNGSFQQALRLIHIRACDGVSVDEVLNEMNISRSTLERQFQRHLGHTPAREMMLVRVAAAKELLSTTDLPIKRIAALIGCHSVPNFYDFLRRHAGRSPGEFRPDKGPINAQGAATPRRSNSPQPGRGGRRGRNMNSWIRNKKDGSVPFNCHCGGAERPFMCAASTGLPANDEKRE